MHKPAIAPLVYARLFLHPDKERDPESFQAHITRNLIPEVRAEILCFYGQNDCLEAQYPGLDYAKPAHRLRLGRFSWHRRLFRVFDALRLTNHEIHQLCRWEGTKWARERWEKDEGKVIRDTTWDDIEAAPQSQHPTASVTQHRAGASEGAQEIHEAEEWLEREDEEMGDSGQGEEEAVDEEEDGEEEDDDEDEEGDMEDTEDEVVAQSVGVDLNQRLLAATEARARGEEGVVLDADWEQWLKEAAERGTTTLPGISSLTGLAPGPNHPTQQGSSQWGQFIPEIFRYGPGTIPPPHVEAMRAQMPPPPLYLPANQNAVVLDESSPGTAPAGTVS